jgi:cytochrome c peroxidase
MTRIALAGVAFVLAIGAFDTNHTVATAADVDADLLNDARSNFQPLPKDMATPEFPITPSRVELGRKLFFDPRISVDGTVSCARCHLPALYGTDGLPKARGAHDTLNPRNAPTILNAALQFKAHWRGDRENVEDEAKQVLIGAYSFINPDYASAVARIKAIPGYADLFRKEFPGDPDPVTPDNWAKAIGAFQRTLVTPSRFDAFLAGDARALSPEERTGLRKIHRYRVHRLPQRRGGRRRQLPKVRRRRGLLDRDGEPAAGQRPLRRDARSAGHLRVQGAESAQRRDDAALFP